MMLARGFFIISVLAVISSASAGLIAPTAQGYGQGQHRQDQAQPPEPDRYFGPSQFA